MRDICYGSKSFEKSGSQMNGFELIGVLALSATATVQAYSIAVTDANAGALSYHDGQFTGHLAPLYQCAIDTVDQPFTVSILPQVRALRMLENNEIDMVLPLAQSGERDDYAYFAAPLYTVRYVLFTLPGVAITGSEHRIQIAVNWSSASIALIEALGHEVIPVDHHELAIGMVRRGRAHGVVIPEPTAAAMTEELAGLVPHDYAQLPGGVYVNKHNTSLQTAFNMAIQDCRPAP